MNASNESSKASPGAPAGAPIIERITEQQLHEFKDAFNNFDFDGSGFIDKSELKKLCEWVGQNPTDDEVTEMMALADVDGSGSIDFWEFATLMAYKMGEVDDVEKKLRAAFRTLDSSGDGSVSTSEIEDLMRALGEAASERDIERVMDDMDANKDGRVDYNEITQVVTREMRASGYSFL